MEKKVRKISEKQIKLVIVIFVVLVVIVLLLWGMVPSKIYNVSEILEKPENFNGIGVNVTGIVTDWESTSRNFSLLDSNDENLTINVEHSGALPEGFGNNETVVVAGIFNFDNNNINSNSIQIGCPSKY